MIGEIVYHIQSAQIAFSQIAIILKNVNVEVIINVYYAIQHLAYVWVVTMKKDIMPKVMIQMNLLNAIIVGLKVIILIM